MDDTKIKLNENEEKVLKYLDDFAEDRDEGVCTYTKFIAKGVGLDEKKARRAIRSLVRKGMAEYHRGLFDDDGMVAGSGYCISDSGKALLNPCDVCGRSITYKYVAENGLEIRECGVHYKQSPRLAQMKLNI